MSCEYAVDLIWFSTVLKESKSKGETDTEGVGEGRM